MSQGKWTKGEWFPERAKPTFNPGADAFQRAIVQEGKGRIIPGFAFGETEEECKANSWLLASAKELLLAVQKLLDNAPDAVQIANDAMYKAMGHIEP